MLFVTSMTIIIIIKRIKNTAVIQNDELQI